MTLAAHASGALMPDMTLSVRQVFGIDTNLEVPAYSQPDEHVPDVWRTQFLAQRRVAFEQRRGNGREAA